MDTGLQQRNPEYQAEEHVARYVRNSPAIERQGEKQRHAGDRQHPGRKVAGVKQRDDRYGGQVVEDGDRKQERFQRYRNPVTERAQQCQCERDVGRRRNGPSVNCTRVAPVQCCIDASRRQYSAGRANRRQGDALGRRQFAFAQLSLDLKADEKEEHGHQAVIDPQQQGLVDSGLSDANGQARVQQQIVGSHKRGIRYEHRQRRGAEQEDPAGRLKPDEILQSRRNTQRVPLVAHCFIIRMHRVGFLGKSPIAAFSGHTVRFVYR